VNQFAGFFGLAGGKKGSKGFFDKICRIFKINRKEHLLEFFDIIKKIEIPRAGAFVARMWLSKSKLPQASLRPFHF
jgi:hypothetical protein